MHKLGLKEAEKPEIKLPTFDGSQRKQGSSRKTPTSASSTTPKSLTVWATTDCGRFLKRWERRRNLRDWHAAQEATVRTLRGTADWFTTGKGVHKGCILSPYLFNPYAEYIM